MSKIINALKSGQGAQTPQSQDKETLTSAQHLAQGREAYTLTQEQLADVYFNNSKQEGQGALPSPTIIRVAEKQKTFFLPWVLTFLGLCLASFALFSTKKIIVDVKFVDEPAKEVVSEKVIEPQKTEIVTPESVSIQLPLPETTINLNAATSDTIAPNNFSFAGAASLHSSKTDEQLVLANSSVSGIAHALYNWPQPFQANNYQLIFDLRSEHGNEAVEFIFKDANGNTSLNWKPIRLQTGQITTDWQTIAVKLESSDFFKANVLKQWRIEIGSQRTANSNEAKVYIRNIHWKPIDE